MIIPAGHRIIAYRLDSYLFVNSVKRLLVNTEKYAKAVQNTYGGRIENRFNRARYPQNLASHEVRTDNEPTYSEGDR